MDCRLDMVVIVCGPERHSDKVSSCMYTAWLECVMEIKPSRVVRLREQGGCLCESVVNGGSQRSGNASACSELQSDWGPAVGRGLLRKRNVPGVWIGERKQDDMIRTHCYIETSAQGSRKTFLHGERG